jgi:hypothetical protein
MVTGQAAPIRAPMQLAQAPDTIRMASEVDVPWAIALLSDRKAPMVKRSKQSKRVVVAARRTPLVTDPTADEVSLDVVLAQPHDPTEVKPATAVDAKPPAQKACGVVNRRS